MKKSIVKYLLVVLIASLSSSILAQYEAAKHLGEDGTEKIRSAQELINKGKGFVDQMDDVQKEINLLYNSGGKIKQGKVNGKLKEKAKLKMQSAKFFEDGYSKIIGAYDAYLKELEKQSVDRVLGVRETTNKLNRDAKKKYGKVESMKTHEGIMDLIDDAMADQEKAIKIQESFIEDYALKQEQAEREQKKAEQLAEQLAKQQVEPVAPVLSKIETPVVNSAPESLSPQPTPEPVVSEAPVVTETAKAPVAAPIPAPVKVAPKKDVFLSIQIMAGQDKVSQAALNQKYRGNLEIIERNNDGWYRYSVGKFKSVIDAKSEMKSQGIKGFIVAYNGQQRISVKEALSLIE